MAVVMTNGRYEEIIKETRMIAIDELAEAICKRAEEEGEDAYFPDGLHGNVVEVDDLKKMVGEIAEQLKGGAE